MEKTERFGFWLTTNEKFVIAQLAELEGGLSQAALIRRLIRKAATEYGIHSVSLQKDKPRFQRNSQEETQQKDSLNG